MPKFMEWPSKILKSEFVSWRRFWDVGLEIRMWNPCGSINDIYYLFAKNLHSDLNFSMFQKLVFTHSTIASETRSISSNPHLLLHWPQLHLFLLTSLLVSPKPIYFKAKS